MNCNERFEILLDFVNGNLSGDELSEASEHIRNCPTCRARVKNLQAMEQTVGDALRQPIDTPNQTAAIMSRLPKMENRPLRKMRWAWASAFGLAVIAVGSTFLLQHPKLSRKTVAQAPAVRSIRPKPSTPPKTSLIAEIATKPETAEKSIKKNVEHALTKHVRRHCVVAENPRPSDDAAPVIAVQMSMASSGHAKVSEITTVVIAGKPVIKTSNVSNVEKPLPANTRVAWRPPLDPKSRNKHVPELRDQGRGG